MHDLIFAIETLSSDKNNYHIALHAWLTKEHSMTELIDKVSDHELSHIKLNPLIFKLDTGNVA